MDERRPTASRLALQSAAKAGSAVTHQTASAARTENPGNRFYQAAGRVDNAWDVDQFKVAGLLPMGKCWITSTRQEPRTSDRSDDGH